MKRQFAILCALTFMVSGMASIAEETAAQNGQTEVLVEVTEEKEWTAPFEDGAWLSVPEWNAEVYLPLGWKLLEVTQTGFIVTDAEGTSLMTATVEDFLTEESAAEAEEEAAEETTGEAVSEKNEDAAEETSAETDGTEVVELTEFENYLMGQEEEYELVTSGEREMAVLSEETSVLVKFVVNDRLVTLVFAPAGEGSIADSALAIAETFYIYEVTEETEIVAETTKTATEETAEETGAEEVSAG